MTMNPGASHTSEGHDERTDEYLVVIKGSLIITLDDDVRGHGSDVHNLRAGDSISFHSNKTHTYHNPGKAQSKLMTRFLFVARLANFTAASIASPPPFSMYTYFMDFGETERSASQKAFLYSEGK